MLLEAAHKVGEHAADTELGKEVVPGDVAREGAGDTAQEAAGKFHTQTEISNSTSITRDQISIHFRHRVTYQT